MLVPQRSGDELGGQRVQHVGFLQLQSFQLSFDLLKGDAMKTFILVAQGNKPFPEFPMERIFRNSEEGSEAVIKIKTDLMQLWDIFIVCVCSFHTPTHPP